MVLRRRLRVHIKYGSDGIRLQCISEADPTRDSQLNRPMACKSSPPCIVWFRDDLRLSDHYALHAASKTAAPTICLYVLDEVSGAPNARPLGGAARWWLAQSLRALQKSLNSIGGALVLRKGPAAGIIAELARETGAEAVFWNEVAQGPHQAVADQAAAALKQIGVTSQSFPSDLLVAPVRIRTKENRGLRVFTPFWRRVQALGDPPVPVPAPKRLRPGPTLASDAIEDWGFEPTRPDWAGGLREIWTPGEISAHAQLNAFLEGDVAGYAIGRDRPDRNGTSRLSPHLRFGEISPRQIWHAARFAVAGRHGLASDIDKFLSELGWREFCRHLLFDVPDLASRNLQPAFNAFPWKHDDQALQAWQHPFRRVSNLRGAWRSSPHGHRSCWLKPERLGERNVTAAYRSVSMALRHDPKNPEAAEFLRKLRAYVEGRQAEQRVDEVIRKAQGLMLIPDYDEAIATLMSSGPDLKSPRLLEFLERVQAEKLAYERKEKLRQAIAKATDLPRDHRLEAAVPFLERLQLELPEDRDVSQLLAYAQREQAAVARAKAVESMTSEARARAESRDFDGALAALDRALKEYPEESGLIRLLNNTLAAKDAWEAQQAIQSIAANCEALRSKRRFSEAVQALEGALQNTPPNPSCGA